MLLSLLCTILSRRKKRKQLKKRRYWIKHLYQDRSQLDGIKLMDLLSLDESTGHFKKFLRMSANDFEFLINKIGPKIAKMDTKLRKAITVKEILAVEEERPLCLNSFFYVNPIDKPTLTSKQTATHWFRHARVDHRRTAHDVNIYADRLLNLRRKYLCRILHSTHNAFIY